MPVVMIRLEDPPKDAAPNPPVCPRCGSVNVRIWGQSLRRVQDTQTKQVQTLRYACDRCYHTFRVYPRGVDRSLHSVRIRRLAGLIWLMDLSCRDVEEVFNELGVKLNRMTIWREGVKLVDQLNQQNLLNQQRRISIDKEGDLTRRPTGGVVLVLSLSPGKYTVLGTLNTHDPQAVINWLQPIVKGLDIAVTIFGTTEFTGEVNSYGW